MVSAAHGAETRNLLLNPGAEDGVMAPWITFAGPLFPFDVTNEPATLTPGGTIDATEGDWWFRADGAAGGSSGLLQQIVDVRGVPISDLGFTVIVGGDSFAVSNRTPPQLSTDAGYDLEFFDANMNSIGSPTAVVVMGQQQSPEQTLDHRSMFSVPSNTRFIEFSVIAIDGTSGVTRHGFDNLHLSISAGTLVQWTAASGDWNTTANWSSDPALPGAADNVLLTPAGNSTIAGPAVSTTIRSLTVGSFAASDTTTLNLQAVPLTVSSRLIVGGFGAGGGALNVAGGQQLTSDSLEILNGGTLTAQSGAILSSANGSIGASLASAASVMLDGATWTNADSLSVGNGGEGMLTVTGGGVVSSASGAVGACVGDNCVGSEGLVTFSDTGSMWTIDGSIEVGRDGGVGTVNIQNGAELHSGGVVSIGQELGVATVDVTGPGSRWDATGGSDMFVGDIDGTGTINIRGGGVLDQSGDVILGSANLSGTKGAVLVQDAGSEFHVRGDLDIGDAFFGDPGIGELVIREGGHASTGGVVSIAAESGSIGLVTVAGAGSTWTNSNDVHVGGRAAAAGGTGTLTMGAGSDVTVGGTLKLWNDGTLNLSGGQLETTVLDLTSGTFNMTGGRLAVETVTGTLDIEGGTLAPGDSPGLTTVTGAYVQQVGATLEIEIAGTTAETDHDVLSVIGNTAISGLVSFKFIDGFAPSQGDAFEFLVTSGVTDLALAQFDVRNLLPGFDFDIVPSGGRVSLIALGDGVFAHLIGDTNGDGIVNIDDLNNVRNHFGATGPDDGTLTGDAAPFDGLVDIDDLNAVRNNFGISSATAAVPEPAAGVLALIGVVFGSLTRRFGARRGAWRR